MREKKSQAVQVDELEAASGIAMLVLAVLNEAASNISSYLVSGKATADGITSVIDDTLKCLNGDMAKIISLRQEAGE